MYPIRQIVGPVPSSAAKRGKKPDMPLSAVRPNGFSFIELLVVIVVIGILASAAMQSMTATITDVRRVQTEREMAMLARAIVGDPSLTQNGARSDFGYVGDVGAFPPNLQALYQNPGGYATWNGPYITAAFSLDSIGFRTDEWGTGYSYSGGTTITSTGSGSTIAKKIADATSDYLSNRVTGSITDADGAIPGATYADSIEVVVSFPNGAGGTAAKTYHPDAAGRFTLDSLPSGQHLLRIVYTPDADTLVRQLTVLPRHRDQVTYRLAATFSGSGSTSVDTLVLRPNGAGALTDLASSGCSANYQCVQEAAPDGDATLVIRASGTFATDVYALENPVGGSGAIQSVTVFCQARRTQAQGQVQLVVYTGGAEYRGAAQDLTTSYASYSETWTTDPSGGQWTWADLTSFQAGVRLSGQNSNFPGYCTQVWVQVIYEN
jgi:prepilin-type N-terminal cleavage/methylation domain-containing protein